MTTERTLHELDQSFTNCAVAVLTQALAAARAHADSPEIVDYIKRLRECELRVSAAREQVTVELFAPNQAGDTVSFFRFTAIQETLQ